MNRPVEATAATVIYHLLWVCSANGMNEATDGHIKIHMVAEWMDNGGLSNAIGGIYGSEATREDFTTFMTDGSAKTSATGGPSNQHIPSIAELDWGSWEATLYGFYNPHSDSFRSVKGGLDDFSLRSMNEWMEMGLMGHSVTQIGIKCPQRDDNGHEILVFYINRAQSRQESFTSMLFAKRVIGEESVGFSEREFRELGINPRINTRDHTMKHYHSLIAASKPDHGVPDGENPAQGDGRTGRTVFSVEIPHGVNSATGDGRVCRTVSSDPVPHGAQSATGEGQVGRRISSDEEVDRDRDVSRGRQRKRPRAGEYF